MPINISNLKLLVIIALVILLIYLNIKKKITENMTVSVRKMEDYYTTKTDSKQKILELSCLINDKKYKMGFVNKNKFSPSCNICGKSNLENIYPVLVDSSLISKKSCENDELINCYNNDVVADCKTNAETICNQNKMSSSCSEFMLYNIQQKTVDKDGNIKNPSYILRLGDDKSNLLSLNSTEITVKNTVTNVNEKKIAYFTCCDKIINEIPDNDKFYLEQDVEKTDKIRFKIYFMLPDEPNGISKKKYLGYSPVDLCDNSICKNDNCKNSFKSLTLYADQTSQNIIVFEPELVRFD